MIVIESKRKKPATIMKNVFRVCHCLILYRKELHK